MNARDPQGSGVHGAVKTSTTRVVRATPATTSVRNRTETIPAADPALAAKWVLIVNKDYKEASQVRNSLEASGYEVSAWITSEDGRDSLKLRKYEIVVASTNVGAPLDAFIGDLRPMRPPPKVILVTDEDEGDAAARCFLPTVVVVNRPFKINEVADIADHLTGGAR